MKILNELKDIILDRNDPDVTFELVQNLYLSNEDPWQTITWYLGDYYDEYDVIGAMEELCTNDEHGNLILKEEAIGHADFIQNILDAHHITHESYLLETKSGFPIYFGDNQEDLVDAFISIMDEAYDTEAGAIDYQDMLEIMEEGTPLKLTVVCKLAERPSVRMYYGN